MRTIFKVFFSLFLLLAGVSCEKMDLTLQVDEENENEQRHFGTVLGREIISDADGNDIPDNDGVKNVLLNADQITGLLYETTAPFNALRSYQAGQTIKGIVYSSTRFEDLFCPNNVSFLTYLTAMSNPNSYQYTIDISSSPYSIQGYAKAYYGQVCTSFVQYALGIKYNFQIYQMTVWKEFDKISPNSVNSLMLGDILTSLSSVHTRLVTGIKRKNGEVSIVTLSEGNGPAAFKAKYTSGEIQKMIDEQGYSLYRYRYIADVKYPPLEYNDMNSISINKTIMPRRGDKANWRKDESIIVDVLDGRGYSKYKVFKNGQLFKEAPLTLSVINFGVMPAGDYSMVLTDGQNDSDPVYWMVIDYRSQVKLLGNGKVKVSFSSENATPIWLTWRRPWSEDSYYNDMPLWTTVIDEKSCERGYIVSELDKYLVDKYGLGRWDFKVAYETKYGIISGDSVEVVVK